MSDTIAALSTPTGPSAIAVVRISGGSALRLAEGIFFKKNPAPRRTVRASYANLKGEILDDAVFTFFKAPASYTGEDMLEISSHGNPFIVQSILEDLFARGCRPADPGEFTRRAFMNDKMDLSQAEAVALLIDARSAISLRAAQKQLGGELGRRIGALSEELLDIAALIEAYIDFPDEDLPPEDKARIAESARSLAEKLSRLIETSKYSPLVHQGLNMVIAGAPNAGKSSLLNELLGQDRAIVSPVAGTTRDFISEKLILGDYAVNITDTAGLRDGGGEIEIMGIQKALEKIESSDICLLTLDTTAPVPALPDSAKKVMTAQNTIAVLNKCDLPSSKPEAFEKAFSEFPNVRVSCKSSEGISQLRNTAIAMIKEYHIRAAADDILVSARHAAALERAKASIAAAAEKISLDIPGELAASDIRDALDALGEITGKTDCEQILDRIFSRFCIGK